MHINKAELAIIQKHYQVALSAYENAFQYRDTPFAQDLYNAAVCAVKLKKKEKAIAYCFRLAGKGVGSAFFRKKQIFNALRDAPNWLNLIEQAENNYALYKERNQLVSDLIDSIYAKDQAAHEAWAISDHSMRSEQKVKMVDDSLSHVLVKVFESFGYLSEDVLGVNVQNDTILDLEPKFSVVILHNYQGRVSSDTLFSRLLYTSLQQGKIKPEFLAEIQDRGSRFTERDFYGNAGLYTPYKCVLYAQKLTRQEKKNIEDKRRAIGLYPLADYEQKIVFNLTEGNDDFLINAFVIGIRDFGNMESEQIFLKESKIVLPKITNCKKYNSGCRQ